MHGNASVLAQTAASLFGKHPLPRLTLNLVRMALRLMHDPRKGGACRRETCHRPVMHTADERGLLPLDLDFCLVREQPFKRMPGGRRRGARLPPRMSLYRQG
jgi:hypothetical protein